MTRIFMTVTVLDTNDNQPEFTHSRYVFSLPDIVSPGFAVGSVQVCCLITQNSNIPKRGTFLFTCNKLKKIKIPHCRHHSNNN